MKSQKKLLKFDFRVCHSGFSFYVYDLLSEHLQEKCIGSKNFECRQNKTYINPSERINYIFNSSIKGIEESDFILLVGTNPRLEATILNARIRKAYVKSRLKIYSIGDPGDLTYPYKKITSNTSSIKESYVQEKGNELWLCNCFIKKYEL